MTSFQDFGLADPISRALKEENYVTPTPIQAQTIPIALTGRDVVGIAQTGTGKTAAFALPILHRILENRVRPQPKACRVLVLSPTRELSGQILDSFNAYGRHMRLTSALAIGGVPMGRQVRSVMQGVEVMVATPGRLLDLVQSNGLKLGQVEFLVLDEADRMLDMGFINDIRKIVSKLPVKRQTLFFSATMPAAIVELSREMLKNPVTIAIERKSLPATGITQSVFPVSQDLKMALLQALLDRGEVENAIVFTRTKHRANRVYEQLERSKVKVARIHGNRSQMQRTDALAGFKSGRYRILVATDIAARGIDVEALSHVVNFDVPNMPEDYIHRVGRTARAELTGDAITFVAPDEENDLRAIERAISKRLPRITLPDFDYKQKPAEKLEIPIQERIAAIRAKKAEDRARAKAKLERKNAPQGHGSSPGPARNSPRGGGHTPSAARGRGPQRGAAPSHSAGRGPAPSQTSGRGPAPANRGRSSSTANNRPSNPPSGNRRRP